MEKIESAENKEDKKLERLRKRYEKANEAFVKSKKELVWHLAELSEEEKQTLEKQRRGEPLQPFEEQSTLAHARRKIENAKIKFKDLLEFPEII